MKLLQNLQKIKFIIKLIKKDKFTFSNLLIFIKEFNNFKILNSQSNRNLSVDILDLYPCINDKTNTTNIDPHYIYHTAWASRIIAKIRPESHVDISSYIYFSTLVSAFIPVKFYDYRPAKLILSNLISEVADLLNLPFENNSIKSLSCMHVVEHIGLGRYGDPLDSEGDLKAINELKRVLVKDGSLLFVVPIGQPKIMFNAHRIYSYSQIINYFSGFSLEEFAFIPDNGNETGLLYNPELKLVNQQNYGCGCFYFKKIN
jgi:SAM-dependent methyltransferase